MKDALKHVFVSLAETRRSPDMFPNTSDDSTQLYRLTTQQSHLSIIHSPYSTATGGVGSCFAR